MSIYNKIKVAVIGATGYTGLDLVLMLSKHPKISIKYLCATKNLGKSIKFFDKRINKNLPKISPVNKIDLYGFNSDQVINQNYAKIIDLFKKGVLIKNLIKPHY